MAFASVQETILCDILNLYDYDYYVMRSFMVNEERVIHMTRMAIFEKEKGPEYQPMLKYSKKDYIALNGWVGFFSGTVFFWAIYAAIITYLVSSVIENITAMYIVLIALVGLLGYAAYIILHVSSVRRKADKRYRRGRRMIKDLGNRYAKLHHMYESERQKTKPLLARELENIAEEK